MDFLIQLLLFFDIVKTNQRKEVPGITNKSKWQIWSAGNLKDLFWSGANKKKIDMTKQINDL